VVNNELQEEDLGKPGPSRPIDVHRWSDYPELNSCLAGLVAEIVSCEKRDRARSRRAANQFRDTVRCIILDLYVAWCASPVLEIGVSLGKDSFGVNTRYEAIFLTYDSFRPALNGLVSLGYVEVVRKGFHDPRTGVGRTTRIRATPKLISLMTEVGEVTLAKISFRTDSDATECIVLRDDNKDDIKYTDIPATRQMRAELEKINSALASHWIDLFLTDSEMVVLNERMSYDYLYDDREAPCVDLTAKRLRRIFNNRSWFDGGRFYGGWWQSIPKEYRKWITINEKHTVEVDYSVMHPALLYAEVGATLEGGAYDIGVPSVKRDLIKRVFNQLVNADGRIAPKSDFNEQECGMSWKELQDRVKARHQPIAKYLGTGYGVRLQNKDAAIANRIMLRFLKSGYVCLPVHDSFIVHHALKDELKAIMCEEFFAEAGTSIDAKAKADVIGTGLVDKYEDNVNDHEAVLAGVLSGTGKYAGYETRLNNWWSSRG
jgi:hypothetical protein